MLVSSISTREKEQCSPGALLASRAKVDRGGHRAGRVERVDGGLRSVALPDRLLRRALDAAALVAQRPDDHGGVVARPADHVLDVLRDDVLGRVCVSESQLLVPSLETF